ncbi:phosphotransferase enzyme family protein [Occallatibacter savannae]|uniref:phosphotransferase enzyme family protein n=1 Tax=Occallatibacter savannae TaxID=1002691 RepID=UPI000D694787|nr:aminoglycoside phosphotransferase family protein [Occallatibacter savannae]
MMDEHAVAAVARAFEASGELESAIRYGSGHIHDTYSVRFKEGGRGGAHILLQHINTKIFKNPVAVMENIRRVTTHVRSRLGSATDADRRVLQLVPTREGSAWHVDDEERYWRAYRFIEGAKTFDEVTSERQAFEAAKAFGSFQRMLADLPGERLAESIPHFHDTPKRFTDFEFAVDTDVAGRGKHVRAEIEFAMERRFIAGALVEAGLPERVTHNDTKLNNVMLDEQTGEGICVIDLDTVMPGFAAYDFGDMVRTMTCPAAEDEKDLAQVQMRFSFFEAVLRGYLAGAGDFLTAEERKSLIAGAKVIVFEQGVRFLADYLAGDTYYKVSREGQNLDRCRTQFRLLESIEGQEGEMATLLNTID